MLNLFKPKVVYKGLDKLQVVNIQQGYVIYDMFNKGYLSGYRLCKKIEDANVYDSDKADLIIRFDGPDNRYAYKKIPYGKLKTFHFAEEK